MRREATADRTAQLLNLQAMNLDLLEVHHLFHTILPVPVYEWLYWTILHSTARLTGTHEDSSGFVGVHSDSRGIYG